MLVCSQQPAMLVIGYLRSPYAPMVAAFRQDWRGRLCYGPETGHRIPLRPERSSTDARCRLWFAVSGSHPAGNAWGPRQRPKRSPNGRTIPGRLL